MEQETERELCGFKKEIFILAIGKKILWMDMEYMSIVMERDMKGNYRKIQNMEREHSSIKMAMYIEENGWTMKNKEKDN